MLYGIPTSLQGPYCNLCGRQRKIDPDKFVVAYYCSRMSATEIINELPKLTEAELRAVRQRLLELGTQNEDVAICNKAASDGAAMLERMEEGDAGSQSR
jgi:hypothetical protein